MAERGVRDADDVPSTRRKLILAGGAGAAAAFVASQPSAEAAPGQAVVQGVVNNAGSASTEIRSTSVNPTVVGRNSGPGAAAFFRSENSNGFAGGSNSPNYYGLSAANYSQLAGNGGAIAATGGQNNAIVANTLNPTRAAVIGQHLSSATDVGAGVVGAANATAGVAGIGYPGVFARDASFEPDVTRGDTFSLICQGDVWIQGALYVEDGVTNGPPPTEAAERGTVTLDGAGTAEVAVSAVGGELHYQLTPLGAPAPELHVAREAAGGSFLIAGGRPGHRVSWQVTSADAGVAEAATTGWQKVEANRTRFARPIGDVAR